MASFNNCTFSGYVGRDPELRFFDDGKSVANFSIAVDNRNSETLWVTVKVWGKGAQVISDYVKKGSQLIVSGELRQEEWEKNGVKNSKIVLNCQDFKFIGSKPGSDGSAAKRADSTPKVQSSVSNHDEIEDDIPF